jgi:hypothetical protein
MTEPRAADLAITIWEKSREPMNTQLSSKTITRQTRVESWRELNEALYDIPQTRFGRHRSNFVYRGLADQAWNLKTSLIRLGGPYADVEGPLLRSDESVPRGGDKLRACLGGSNHAEVAITGLMHCSKQHRYSIT